MNRIDRLMLQVRSAARPGAELAAAVIERDGHSWTAAAHLWDGVPGHAPAVRRTAYSTPEAAVAHIRALTMEYPNSRDLPVIIDDMGG